MTHSRNLITDDDVSYYEFLQENSIDFDLVVA